MAGFVYAKEVDRPQLAIGAQAAQDVWRNVADDECAACGTQVSFIVGDLLQGGAE